MSAWHLCKLYTCLSKFKFNKRIFSFCSMTGRTFQRSWYGTTVQCSFPIQYQEVSQLLLPVFVFHFICRYFSNANCIALCDLKKNTPEEFCFWICISNFYHCCRNGKNKVFAHRYLNLTWVLLHCLLKWPAGRCVYTRLHMDCCCCYMMARPTDPSFCMYLYLLFFKAEKAKARGCL